MLRELTNSTTDLEDYRYIWRFLILLSIGKLILGKTPDPQGNKTAVSNLYKFFETYGYDISDGIEQTIRTTIRGSLSANMPFLSGGGEMSVEKVKPEITKELLFNYSESLKTAVAKAQRETNLECILILDELDDRFKNEQGYLSIILNLVKEVAALNRFFAENKYVIKIVIVLRTDIFLLLRDVDINKIHRDNSLTINWGSKIENNSPLLEMVYYKIRKSLSEFKDDTSYNIRSALFPQTVKNDIISFENYLLSRTFFHPRDVISYLNFISQDKYFEQSIEFEEQHFIKKLWMKCMDIFSKIL